MCVTKSVLGEESNKRYSDFVHLKNLHKSFSRQPRPIFDKKRLFNLLMIRCRDEMTNNFKKLGRGIQNFVGGYD